MGRLIYHTANFLCIEGSDRDNYALNKCKLTEKYLLLSEHLKEQTRQIMSWYGYELPTHWLDKNIVLDENCNPFIMYLNGILFVYFGDDIPQICNKSVKTRTKHYKFWTKDGYEYTFRGGAPEIKKYYYAKVKESNKLFIFIHNNVQDKFCDWEIIEQTDDYTLAQFDLAQDTYEKLVCERIAQEQAEKQAEEERLLAEQRELERRKMTEGYCSCCGAEYAHLGVHPYNALVYRDFRNVWICKSCYDDALDDLKTQ